VKTSRTAHLFSIAAIAVIGIVASAVAVTDRLITSFRVVSNLVADFVLRAVAHVAAAFMVEQPKVSTGQMVEHSRHLHYLARQLKRERVRKEAGWCMAPST
jgi:hypothetical protein